MLTIAEIEARKVSLEAELETALEVAKVLVPATVEFDEAYGRYLGAKAALAKIPGELAAATVKANEAVIKTAGAQIAQGILQMAVALELAKLLGAPLIALNFVCMPDGTDPVVVFNPIKHIATKGEGKGKVGKGHKAIVAPDGTKMSLTKFVLAHTTEVERAEVSEPHVMVYTKPKFDEFCTKHNLTGYTLSQGDEEAAS